MFLILREHGGRVLRRANILLASCVDSVCPFTVGLDCETRERVDRTDAVLSAADTRAREGARSVV